MAIVGTEGLPHSPNTALMLLLSGMIAKNDGSENGRYGIHLYGRCIYDSGIQTRGIYGSNNYDECSYFGGYTTISDPSGGAVQDTESRTAINAILDKMIELGFIP